MIDFSRLKNPKTKHWIVASLILLILVYLYWLHLLRYPSTDNAYVQANVVYISPQVSGPILHLYIQPYQSVKKGQPLLDIDPAPFQVTAEQAKAQLDLAKQQVTGLQDTVESLNALVSQREAELKLAQQNYDRMMVLVKKGQMSLSEGDKLTSNVRVANAALTAAKNDLLKAKAELGDSDNRNAQTRSAQSKLDKANLDLQYTHLVSPTDGYVVNLTARVGTTVQKNTPIFAVIDSTQWWVDANYKETQLERIRPRQLASIIVDMYPDHIFHGVVSEVSRGSGSAFSIFPAENATGNWVKITQRFTVRINITDPDPTFPLRIGSSATATIDTKSDSGSKHK